MVKHKKAPRIVAKFPTKAKAKKFIKNKRKAGVHGPMGIRKYKKPKGKGHFFGVIKPK